MKKTGQTALYNSSSERRPLHTYSLLPPDYYIDPQLLFEDYIEKDIRYAGLVPSVSIDVDVTNRTEVLRIIDRGKAERLIAIHSTEDLDAIITIDIHDIKLSRRNNEELLIRLPIHEISSVCYVRDSGQHILVIKYGTGSPGASFHVAVLIVDSKSCAEEICALIGQCFHLVYTEATMQFFDKELQIAAAGSSTYAPSIAPTDTSTLTARSVYGAQSPAFITRSNPDLHLGHQYTTLRSVARPDRTPSSASELSTLSTELLQDYMRKVHRVLSSEELAQFASLLKAKRTSLAFSNFCERILSLFGPERKQLIGGLWPFIAEKDYGDFESFLENNSIGYIESGCSTLSNPQLSLDLTSDSTDAEVSNAVFGAEHLDFILENVSLTEQKRKTSS